MTPFVALACWLLAAAIALLAARALRQDAALAARLGAPARTLRRACRLGAGALALAAVGFALYPAGAEEGEKATGAVPLPVVFVLDASRSMLAPDASGAGETRLAAAGRAIAALMSRLEGGEFAVAAFAGEGAALSPLTRDREAIETLVSGARIGEAPGAGSSLAAGLDAAALLARSRPAYIAVLLSDGEALSGDAVQAARRARARGATVMAVTLGTRAGARLPLPAGGLVTHRGEPVLSKADPEAMAAIAQAGGGRAFAGPDEASLKRLASSVPRREGALGAGRWSPRAAIALGLALGLVLLDFALAGGRPRFRTAAMLLGLGAFGAAGAPGWLTDWRVDADWRAGRAAEAHAGLSAALRTRPQDARLHYDRGLAAFALGRYGEAAEDFEAAARGLREPERRAQARYNQGNARFKQAEAEPSRARAHYRAAVAAYDQALSDRPDDADAKHNRALAARRLAQPPKPRPPVPAPSPSPRAGSGTQPPPLPSGMRQPTAQEAETILKALEADERRQQRAEAAHATPARSPVSDWERDW